MSVSSTSSTSSSLASALGTTSSSSSTTLGEPDFLTLLVTQLQNQDPLNPTDNTAFVAQLAQFSSLQELTNLNTSMTSLVSATQNQEMIGATSFIGKEVTAAGSSLVKSGTSISETQFTLPSNEADVKVYVTDSSGNVVKTTDLGALDAGAQTYQWNGQNTSGTTVSDGTYNVAVYATSTSGTSSLISTTVSGKVTGTQNSSGTFQLTLDNGMTVNFSDVKSVVDSTDSSSS